MLRCYDKIVQGTTKASDEVIIKASKELIRTTYSDKYTTPPIPVGYTYVRGQWNSGFIIRQTSEGSEFVWIPVGSLDADGTLDGVNFNQKFGRRIYLYGKFSEYDFHEELTPELLEQFKSIQKYGGFYFSRYIISKSTTGKPQSKKDELPWVNISFYEAREMASKFENYRDLKSHLTYGAEYDSVSAWFIKCGARTIDEIVHNSSHWGNYFNSPKALKRLIRTGSNEEYCTNAIYDFAGNVTEWTQEMYSDSYLVFRGGCSQNNGNYSPAFHRSSCSPDFDFTPSGFHIALCLA